MQRPNAFRIGLVQLLPSVAAHPHQAHVPQHAQMLRYRRLVDAKHGHNLVHRVLALASSIRISRRRGSATALNASEVVAARAMMKTNICRYGNMSRINFSRIFQVRNESVCSPFRNQLRFPRMKIRDLLLPAVLSVAFPLLFAQAPTPASDPLAPTQDVKSAEQIDREWQQSVSKYDAERNRLLAEADRQAQRRTLSSRLGHAHQVPAAAVVQGREVRHLHPLGRLLRSGRRE